MAAITIAETLASEAGALANGWTAEQLLDLAGERLGLAIGRQFPLPGTAVGFLGKGRNAGDTLVALRVLRDRFGWKVTTRHAWSMDDWDPLSLKKWDELGIRLPQDRPVAWRDLKGPLLLLDGLLGSGSRGALRMPLLQLAREMEMLRQRAGARVAAVDLPSGIDPDSGEIFPGTVTADITFMIGNAKYGLLAAHAVAATGALALVPIEPLTVTTPGDRILISPQTLDCGKVPRPFDFHKGQAGRVAVLAGSAAYRGAAVLAASGALRGGAGLVTLFVPEPIAASIAARCPAEIIVRAIADPREILDFRYDSLVVGCGLGEMDALFSRGVLALIEKSPSPAVIDADALNLIAQTGRTDLLTASHVITPHPGEFAKLAPDLAGLPREVAARRFVDRVASTLLLKGSRTLVTRRDGPLLCNSTGTPGMATGGQGDLLAGVIGARLAAGDSGTDAASLAAWICGRAAEIAIAGCQPSEESLTPGDVLQLLGAAFRDWKSSSR